MKSFEDFYYNNVYKSYDSQCKPCKNETARESAERRKYDNKMKDIIKKAKLAGDIELVKCNKCQNMAPKSSFVPYSNGIIIDDKVYFNTFNEICGLCQFKLNEKLFSQIEGCIKYANERKYSRRSKKAKV